MNRTNWKKSLMSGLVAAVLYGCGPQLPVREVIDSSPPLPTPVEQPVTAVGDPKEVIESFSNDRDWRCTTQKYTAAEAPAEIATFEPSAAVIWPGSLLQGGTLESGSPEPIPVKRAGGTVLMNLLNTPNGATAKSYQVKLSELTQGNVIDAQNSILANNQGSTPAAFDFQMSKIDSQEELALAMHADAQWLTGSVDAKFKFTTDKRYTRYLVKLTQRYYTMVFETPTSLDGVFAPSVTGAELEKYVGPGNPATYISSVTYGRQFYLLIESTSSKQQIEAALNYVYSGIFDASVSAETSYQKIQSETIVHAFAVGGNAESALDTVLNASEGKLDGLRTFIVGGANVNGSNPGLPLSYVVRNVSDNKVVKLGVATEFSRKSCVPVFKDDGSTSLWLDAQALPYSPVSVVRSTWPGRTQVQNDGRNGHAAYVPASINGHPSMWFAYDGTSWAGFDVNLGDGAVVKHDYSVVAVVRTAGDDIARDPYKPWASGIFLQGAQTQVQDYNLVLGFEAAGPLVHGHYYRDLRTQSAPSTLGDVFTFRFSQADGKADWQNGVLRGTAKDQTQPLQANPGARLGFSAVQPFMGFVGEVRVFNYALSPIERATVECELAAKWTIGVANCINGRPDPAKMQY